MDDNQRYSIIFTGILALYPLLWFLKVSHLDRFLKRLISDTYNVLKQPYLIPLYLRYSLALRRRYWMSITKLEAIVFASYLGVNFYFLYRGRSNLAISSASLATINAVPLFLGGRTNPLADRLHVPLSTYYVFHHLFGRVVIFEGLLHSAIFLSHRPIVITFPGFIVSG
jgi:hypothetical protein